MSSHQDPRSSTGARGDLTWLVAVAASLWGASALMREPLLGMGLSASMIVLAEHAILVLVLLPRLRPALRTWSAQDVSTRLAMVLIGAGASALATTLFTAAFGLGDPITPQVLQKLQPLLAILLAAVLLGERLRPRFWLFAVPAILGAWLLAFPDPTAVDVASAQAAALAVSAAALWAAGTVLGRRVSGDLGPTEVTTLRFFFGLVTMVAIVAVKDDWSVVPARAAPLLLVQALVPGLLALSLYYRGLQRTPASRATVAELAFPVTAAAVGVLVLGASLAWSQWAGFAIVLVAVTGLALHERAGRTPAVDAPVEAAAARPR